eukprot:TRINITY_DN314_c2_g1_i2.p1 TRINITY_DN314_c2_g1~~TRINITY_DN314_c2_g1_i2.p1  ORF type:complete len:569 (-),score=115.55 TRINITY_DN314_c2_g1_i2:831-2366(-)
MDGESAPLIGRIFRGKSALVVYAFTINFVFGAGVLQLPYCFYKVGVILGCILLLAITILAFLNAYYVVESITRSVALQETSSGISVQHDGKDVDGVHGTDDGGGESDGEMDRERILGSESRLRKTIGSEDEVDRQILSLPLGSLPEVSDVCQHMLGRPGKLLWEVSTLLFCVGAMWLYCVIWASSATAVIPIPFVSLHHDCTGIQDKSDVSSHCVHAYWIYLAFFVTAMIPVVTMNMQDQVKLQVSLTIFAFSVLIVMVTTVIAAAFTRPYQEGHKKHEPFTANVALFDLSGISVFLPAAVFSQLVTHGIPQLFNMLGNRKKGPTVFLAGMMTTCTIYTFVAVICALYFGSHIEKVITLNWTTYSGDAHSHIIGYLVVLFPVISITAVFPLYTITAGNNLFKAFPLATQKRLGPRRGPLICRFTLMGFAATGAYLQRDVTVVTTFTGLSGFFLYIYVPAWLQWKGKSLCKKRFGYWKTEVSSFLSCHFVVILDLVIGTVGFFSVIYFIVMS